MDTLLEAGSPRRGSMSSLHRQSSNASHYSHNSKLASPGNNNITTTNASNPTSSPNANTSNSHKDLDRYTRYFIIKSVQVIVQSRIAHQFSPNTSTGGNGVKPSTSSSPSAGIHPNPTTSPSPGLANNTNNNTTYSPGFTHQNSSGARKFKTECKPHGNEWFNLHIPDVPEVRDTTKAALDSGLGDVSVKSNWRVCCEISMKTSDGSSFVLEHWILSNKSLRIQAAASTSLLSSTSKMSPSNQNQSSSPKSPQINRNSSPTHASNNNNPSSAINNSPQQQQQSPTRYRTSTFSNTMRTRLNSIEDCSLGDNSYLVSRLYGTANDNYDPKATKSCYSLSNSPAIPNLGAGDITANVIPPSPSINSLPINNNLTISSTIANAAQTSNNVLSPSPANIGSQGAKITPVSSIYTIYNRMSLLLKTLMTTTHIIPAQRLASKLSKSDQCVISYRVYTCPTSTRQNNRVHRGSCDDINYNPSNDSPSKQTSSTSSNSSFDSLNIKDFVAFDEIEHFCPILNLGTIKTDINELDLSVCYRIDVTNPTQILKSPRNRGMYDVDGDEDCIIAAKQLLAGNEYNRLQQNKRNEQLKKEKNSPRKDPLSYLDEPLRPPFASHEPKFDPNDESLQIMDSMFEKLLEIRSPYEDEKSNLDKIKNGLNKSNALQSNAQPDSSKATKSENQTQSNPPGTTCKALLESFVWVDINPPFASDEQSDIASFFNGPSPVFSHGFDSLKDIDEVTNQLADLEANASLLDEFVDNICMTEDEHEPEDDNQDKKKQFD